MAVECWRFVCYHSSSGVASAMSGVSLWAICLAFRPPPARWELRVLHLVDALRRHLRHPLLEWLHFRRWNRLYQPEQLFCIRHVRKVAFAVGRLHFQLVTICYRLVPFLCQSAFQYLPVLASRLVVAVGEHRNHVHHREPPLLRIRIPSGAHPLLFEKLYCLFLCHTIIFHNP